MRPTPSHEAREEVRSARLLALLSGPGAVGLWGWISFGAPGALGVAFLAALIGPWVGLASDAPYFTAAFRLGLAAALLAAVALIGLGMRARRRWIGCGAVAMGSLVWTVAGAVGFGPQ